MLNLWWVLVSSNGLHFLMGWEGFTLSAYFLITLDRARNAVRSAGLLYLVASHVGTMFLFAFFTGWVSRTGGWDLGSMRGDETLKPLFWLALVGFGIKAGVFPVHFWLPSAHSNAPSHVSAVMSGVAIKMGIYGLVRFSGWLPLPAGAGWVMLALGMVSAVMGVVFALAQNDYKRLLAYCSVENVGIIFMALGGSMLARTREDATWGVLLFAGAMMHIWNHGVFKALLFLGAGSVLHSTGTREISRLGGLWRGMPWTACVFAVGSAAACGLPVFNGFVGEWLIALGFFDAASAPAEPLGLAAMAVVVLGVSGALALATFVKVGSMLFLGAARTQPAVDAKEGGRWMRWPMVGLAVVCVLGGIFPILLRPVLLRSVGVWNPSWVANELEAPLAALGGVHAGVALLAVGLGILVLKRSARGGIRRSGTWDCGYAKPTSHMQYGSGSFAGVVLGWFRWALRPSILIRRPRGYFPEAAIRVEEVPETVLYRVLGPVLEGVLYVSTRVRRLQHGRAQSYILYLVIGILVLSLIAWAGGER